MTADETSPALTRWNRTAETGYCLQVITAEGEMAQDDKTAIELFLIGVRALALQSSIIDVVRIASQFSTATG